MRLKIELQNNLLKRVEKDLGNLGKKAPAVLKKALNTTAKKAKSKLLKETKNEYAAKRGVISQSSIVIKKASVGKLAAVLESKGPALELLDFKASPKEYTTGLNRPKLIKAKVLKKGSMKALKSGNIKAFIVKFKNGHISIAQRVPGRKMKSNPDADFIKKLLSPSVSQMIGNEEKVFGKVEPEIESDLHMYLNQYVAELL